MKRGSRRRHMAMGWTRQSRARQVATASRRGSRGKQTALGWTKRSSRRQEATGDKGEQGMPGAMGCIRSSRGRPADTGWTRGS